ncbi:MAG: alkaline phosphatase family protein [Victivallales bacterium]|nr:alkaline phosphatase family protein [Victivallales bacterium]
MTPSEQSAAYFKKFEEKYNVNHCTGDFTPTLCELFGVPKPDVCGGTAIAEVVDQANHLFGGDGKCERALIFCPDAVGQVQYERHPEILTRVEKIAGFKVPSVTMMPSVTPVCFGTIFSGASPDVHGIQEYAKPVLAIETLFDVFAKAEKRVAILAINKCSIDTIFRMRNVDYFSFRSDQLVEDWTVRLMELDEYDFIVSYMTMYDHVSHKKGPWSPEATAELELSATRFERYCALADKLWADKNRVVTFIPDHGNHQVDADTGAHGKDIPDDMLVNHFYRLRGK